MKTKEQIMNFLDEGTKFDHKRFISDLGLAKRDNDKLVRYLNGKEDAIGNAEDIYSAMNDLGLKPDENTTSNMDGYVKPFRRNVDESKKITIDIDFTIDDDDDEKGILRSIEKKYKIKIKYDGNTKASLTGDKKSLNRFVNNAAWYFYPKDSKRESFPELLDESSKDEQYFIERILPKELPYLLTCENLANEAEDFPEFRKLSKLISGALKEAKIIAKKYKIKD